MTPSQKLIYSHLEKEGPMAHKEVMRAAGLSKGRVSWILLGLYERGHVSHEEIDGTRYHRAIPLYSGLPDIPAVPLVAQAIKSAPALHSVWN